MATYKEVIGNELYVYMNGALLYKRWIDQGHGMIIGCSVYGNFRPSVDTWQHVNDTKNKADELLND